MGDATHLPDILGELALKYLATASILRIVLMVTKLVNSLSATGHGSKSLCDIATPQSTKNPVGESFVFCAGRENRFLQKQYPLWILLLFYTKVSRNSFDSPCPSTEIYEKAPFRGSFLFLCGQGESNSRLILGKDVLYHLTMPAVSVLRQKLWRQYRVLEQIVQLAICHRQNCDTERD